MNELILNAPERRGLIRRLSLSAQLLRRSLSEQLLTVPDAAFEARVGRTTIYKQIGSGNLVAVKVGRLTRIRRSDLEDWMRRLGTYRPVEDRS
jgi:excisionase family DNA binding protein